MEDDNLVFQDILLYSVIRKGFIFCSIYSALEDPVNKKKDYYKKKHRLQQRSKLLQTGYYIERQAHMERLYDKLVALSKEDYYPMHMPGHKRNTQMNSMINPYELDITEIDGFDNLHQPEGILLSLSERLSRLYHAGKSYPLVNGSTAGILAGISACANRGDKVLLARNSHKSVYHGLILMGLTPLYCYPQKIEHTPIFGGILPSDIEEALIKNPDIKLVIITSPSYEGVVSDIRSIAQIVHRYGARLLVDEAHGAHFGFHPYFPTSAVNQGADLIIQSLHKTLPAFTQTAVLHCNAEELYPKVAKYLSVYESSSPSYLLMAGIDRCVHLLESRAKELFKTYEKVLADFYQSMQGLKRLSLFTKEKAKAAGCFAFDPSKLVLSTRETGLSGHALQALLRERYHIELEMAAAEYALAMTSICDTREGFERLGNALLEIEGGLEKEAISGCFDEQDDKLSQIAVRSDIRKRPEISIKSEVRVNQELKVSPDFGVSPEGRMLPWQAWTGSSRQVEFKESAGKISAAFICLFPPGSPVLVPGELISQELIDYIEFVRREGISVTGLNGEFQDKIEVVYDNSPEMNAKDKERIP